MKKHILFPVLIAASSFVSAQSTESIYPKTLYSPNDTFWVTFSNYSHESYPMVISEEDTVDMGTNGAPGLNATLKYGKDSMKIEYKNMPYFQVHYIPFSSPKGKTIYRLHFNSTESSFSEAYVKANTGKVNFEIPEVYELANIIWMLSPSGIRERDIDTTLEYYKKVISWFKPYMDHPIFKKLDAPDSNYSESYYSFRENSFTFNFDKNVNSTKLLYEGPYYYVTGDDWGDFNSLFKELRPMTEDFARKSNFRQFYKNNEAYYNKLVKRQTELMPVKKMWDWLEVQFPKSKYQSYKIVFSPLITGSHSTQNYSDRVNDKVYREAVMFVCGPESFDASKISEQQKEGLMSGIVFTEIDHNYVNPVSYNYKKSIDSLFANRDFWAKEVRSYRNPLEVFNEYMTHALFCLYVMDNYDKEAADYIIKQRISMMVNARKFTKFKEFNAALIDIRNKNKDKKVAELYPELLKWCGGFKG